MMEGEVERSSPELSKSVSFQNLSENHTSSEECERLWHRLQTIQGEVQQLPSKPIQETRLVSPQSPKQSHEILLEYEKRLRAEVILLQEKSLERTLSKNKEVQFVVLQQEQARRKQQLEETLSYLKARHSSLVDSIKQEEELKNSLQKVQETLKDKEKLLHQGDSEGRREDDSDSHADAAIANLKSQVSKLKQTNKYFQSNLKEILSSFPSPPEKTQPHRSSKNALDNTREFDQDKFVCLSTIIGKLMEQTLNHPGQPYLEITEDMWPQHIEFLLRSQVIVKDPDCSSKMKLLPFHL